MSTPSSRVRPLLAAGVVVIAALTGAACGASGGDTAEADATTTTAEAEPATTTTTEPPTTTSTTEAEPEPQEPSGDDDGVVMVGDKSVMLDGFIGVRIPAGWSITSSRPLEPSSSPPGGETELDTDALVQALVINPVDAPRGASFVLVHYEHSDSVPDLDRFTEAVTGLLSGDGSTIGAAKEATIGSQPGRLHQVKSASGMNGVLITLESGDEFFFLLSLVADQAYAADAGDMIASVSLVPEALPT
jgi:hypothetical protein